jgi:hypothetical protein
MPYSERVNEALEIKMGRNVMISRKAKKLVPAREQLQALTPAELAEVSGGGDGYGGGGDDDWRYRHHHHWHHHRWHRRRWHRWPL